MCFINFVKRTIFAFDSFEWTHVTKSMQSQKSAFVRISSSFHFFIKPYKKVGYDPWTECSLGRTTQIWVRNFDRQILWLYDWNWSANFQKGMNPVFSVRKYSVGKKKAKILTRNFKLENSTFLDASKLKPPIQAGKWRTANSCFFSSITQSKNLH